MEQTTPPPRGASCATWPTARRSTRSTSSAVTHGASAATATLSEAPAWRYHGRRGGRDLGRGRDPCADLPDWRRRAHPRPLRGRRALRRRRHRQAHAGAAEDEYQLADLTEAPARPYEEMAAGLAALVETIERPHLRTLLERLIDRSTASGAAYHSAPAAKYYHQAYRHGLLGTALGGRGRERPGARALPRRGRPRPGRHGRAPARHREDRGLRDGQRGDRDDRPRQAARRDPVRLLHGASRDRADRRLSAGGGRGSPPHHPEPPRQARARQPGRALQPRGHARPLHGQPRGNLGSFDRIERSLAEGATWSDFDRGISTSAFFATREQARSEEAA